MTSIAPPSYQWLKLPGLNGSAGLEGSGGSHEAYRQQLQQFAAVNADSVAVVRQLITAGQLQTASEAANELRAQAQAIGASGISRCSEQLCRALADGSPTSTPLISLNEWLSTLITAINQSVPTGPLNDQTEATNRLAEEAVSTTQLASGSSNPPTTAKLLLISSQPAEFSLVINTLRSEYQLQTGRSVEDAEILISDVPDLILLDAEISNSSGIDLLRQIKSWPETASTPIILLADFSDGLAEETGLAAGAADYLHKPLQPALVRARVAAHLTAHRQTQQLEKLVDARTQELSDAMLRLKRETTERERALHHIEYLQRNDALTGLANRAGLRQQLSQAIAKARVAKRSIALFTIDIEHFSAINDLIGTKRADELLRCFAHKLITTGNTPLAARVGANTFSLLIDDLPRNDDTRVQLISVQIAQLLERLNGEYEIGEQTLTVTTSSGIALFPGDAEDTDELLTNSDVAMHAAKADGSREVALYNDRMNDFARECLLLENRLKKALEQRAFSVYYQPKILTRNFNVSGGEALVRWRDDNGRYIPPNRFIPLAESSGMINELSQQIMEDAFDHVRRWDQQLPSGIAINISASKFQHDDLITELRSLLASSGANAANIELEITEGAVVTDVQGAAERMHALRDLGFSLALDDFGNGFSSLEHLHRLPLTSLKVDRAFVHDLGQDARGDIIARSVIELANQLNIRCVAEGVENRRQLEFLNRCGCEEIQGYLFSKAVPAEKFEALFRKGELPPLSA